MKSTYTIFLILLLMSTHCEQRKETGAENADNIYDYTKYHRFILVKGNNVFAPGAKISDFGKLPQEGDVYDHSFSFGEVSGWELIKVGDELDNAYFYNIAYWLLGFGDDDPNHADASAIILTDKETNEIKYLGLIDAGITKIDDSMLLLSDKDEQFIIEIPFHTFKTVDNKFNYSIKNFFSNNSIAADDFKDPILVKTTIRFNEKTGH